MFRKLSSLLISLCLIFQQIGFASMATELNIAGHLSKMPSSLVADRFRPVHIRFFSFDAQNDNIKVMLDKGDVKSLKSSQINESTKELLNYFLVGITLPNDKFWVNLRPDSQDNIIDDWLAKTDVGKIMLEADLQLKKDTAQFTSPQTSEGKEYWNRLYKKAEELYGYQEVSIPTLTRPWIVPNEVIVRESKESAYIYKATLKVMLEQDFLKDSSVYNFKDDRAKALNEYSSQLIRELIIPKLTQEVNLSKRYAPLRQVYYSIVLSRWFKSRFSNQTGKYASRIDRRDLTGLASATAWSKSTYFDAYKKSFAQGEYNIKETVRTPTGQVIRSYFSGGLDLAKVNLNGGRASSAIEQSLLTAGLIRPGMAGDIKITSSPVTFQEGFSAKAGVQLAHDKILKDKIEQAFKQDLAVDLLGSQQADEKKDITVDRTFVMSALYNPDFIISLVQKIIDIIPDESGRIIQDKVRELFFNYQATDNTSVKRNYMNQLSALLIAQTRLIALMSAESDIDPFLLNIGDITRGEHQGIVAHAGTFAYDGSDSVFGGPRSIYLTLGRLNGYRNLKDEGRRAFQELFSHLLIDIIAGKHIDESLSTLINANARIAKAYKDELVRSGQVNHNGVDPAVERELHKFSLVYNEDSSDRKVQISYLLGEIDKELANPGSSQLPYIAALGDYHGAKDRFAKLLSMILNKLVGFNGELDPDLSIESQLRQQGLLLKNLKGAIYLHGDILDRGENGLQCFFMIRELAQRAPGKVFSITGNHDYWAFGNLSGGHLPWYKGFNFYGDKEAEDLIARHRRLQSDIFDTQGAFLWWIERLAEHNADQEEFQKKFLEGKAKELRKKFIGYYEKYSSNWSKGQLDAMEDFIGHFKRIDVPDPYVGLNGMGKTSASWWQRLQTELLNSRQARSGLGADKDELAVWDEAISLADKIDREVANRLNQATAEGKWWYRIFESINNKAYETLEWWFKDWSSHKDWGEAVIKELNIMLKDPKFTHPLIVQDREVFKGQEVTQSNYILSKTLQALALYYRQNFNLYLRDPYKDLVSHSWFPVGEDASIVIDYKGTKYNGEKIYEGLSAIASDVRDLQKSFQELWGPLNLVNMWYADKTTTAKPKDEKKYREIGIAKINSGIGVSNWLTGHNPTNKLKVPFMVQDGEFAHFHLDKAMAPRFGGEGAFVLIGPEGISMYGFTDKDSSEIIHAPDTIIPGKEGEAPKVIKNQGMPAKDFLLTTKARLEKELAGLKDASSPLANVLVLSNIVSLLSGAQTRGYNIMHAISDKANGAIFNHSENRADLEVAMENMLRAISGLKNNKASEKLINDTWAKTLKTKGLNDGQVKNTLDWLEAFLNNGKVRNAAKVEAYARFLTNEIIGLQLRALIDKSKDYKIAQTVLCVGETKDQYSVGRTKEVIREDLAMILSGVTAEEARMIGLRIAYEPRWAIGTGLVPTNSEIQDTHSFIKETTDTILGLRLDVDYGGSLNSKNAKAILALKDVDGGLIGGAAKKPEEISLVIQEAITQGKAKNKILNVGMNWKAENADTGLAPLTAFADLFKQYSSNEVQIAISVPNVAIVKQMLAASSAVTAEEVESALEARNTQQLSNFPPDLLREAPDLFKAAKELGLPIRSAIDKAIYVWGVAGVEKAIQGEYDKGNNDEKMAPIITIDENGVPVAALVNKKGRVPVLRGPFRSDRQKQESRVEFDRKSLPFTISSELAEILSKAPIFTKARYIPQIPQERVILPDTIVKNSLVEVLSRKGIRIVWVFDGEKNEFVPTFRGRVEPFENEDLEYALVSMPVLLTGKRVKELNPPVSLKLSEDRDQYIAWFYGGVPDSVKEEEKVQNNDYWRYVGLSAFRLAGTNIRKIQAAQPGTFGITNISLPDLNGHVSLKNLKKTAELFIEREDGTFEIKEGNGWDSALGALKISDKVVGNILKAVEEKQGVLVLVGDHGSLDDTTMNGHGFNDVPIFVIDFKNKNIKLVKAKGNAQNTQADIAATILHIYGEPKPAEMTGKSLLPDTYVGKGDRIVWEVILDGFGQTDFANPQSKYGVDSPNNAFGLAMKQGLMPTIKGLYEQNNYVILRAAGHYAGLRGGRQEDFKPEQILSREEMFKRVFSSGANWIKVIDYDYRDVDGATKSYNFLGGINILKNDPLLNDKDFVVLPSGDGLIEVLCLDPAQMGSTEYNLATMGGGRIVEQSVVELDKKFITGDFFNGQAWKGFIALAKDANEAIMIDMPQEAAVHDSLRHLLHQVREMRMRGIEKIHFILAVDGRDEGPYDSLKKRLPQLKHALELFGITDYSIDVIGRQVSFDRDKNWQGITMPWIFQEVYGTRRQLQQAASSAVAKEKVVYQEGVLDIELDNEDIKGLTKVTFIRQGSNVHTSTYISSLGDDLIAVSKIIVAYLRKMGFSMKDADDIKGYAELPMLVHSMVFNARTVSELVDSAKRQVVQSSSPVVQPLKKTGGIDFRAPALTIKYQPMGNFAGLNPKLPVLSKAELAVFNIDKELSGMEKLVNSQMIPSGDRLKEVLAACSQKGELGANKERLMALLVKIGIAEETQCCLQEASKEYKEALVLADSLA